MERQSNTKELLMMEGLRLFGERSFGAVKITEISDAVGCAPSAMYKHFENKEKLYDAILEHSREMFKNSKSPASIDLNNPEEREFFLKMTKDEFVDWFMETLKPSVTSEVIKMFRKLMMVEQFNKKELAQMYDERYVNSVYERYTSILNLFMEEGKMVKGDARLLATMLTSPGIVAIGTCDRHPEQTDSIMCEVRKQVACFCDMFFI